MFLFGLGKLVYVIILIINAIAVLSEDRFLARIGWGRTQAAEPGFGATYDNTSVKAKSVNLIASVRTVMRSESLLLFLHSSNPQNLQQACRRPKSPSRTETTRQQARISSQNQLANHIIFRQVPLIVINTVVIAYELILG
ncbi:hypothetical protein N7510_009054 [Penicillium lagena]|uniref:uncharacterized protein n=1 Tax=Penicillium lagena TaxID=94218 RepID=UPI00253FBBF4|nr:uncharacterized protein N7510_009054 [Penicillium lagena]KAJ5606273.1 hypothetical protein N7510_009054 [Penicillium lagena]